MLLAELVHRPVAEALGVLAGKELRLGERGHAHCRTPQAEVPQGLEGAQRIGVEFALIIDAAHPRPLNEIVRQDLVPEIDHFLGFRKEAVAADVEPETLMLHGAADAADIDRVLFDHSDRVTLLGEQIGGGQACRPRPDDRHVNCLAGPLHVLPRFAVVRQE
jgi:hypothetical protein